MATLADLHRTVQDTIASKRLGTLVFVRYQLVSRDKPAAAINKLAGIVAVVRGWLDQPIEQIYALGSLRGGQVTLTLEGRGGVSAVVSWASSQTVGTGVDLFLVGNHGAAYHDSGTSILWEEPISGAAAEAPAALRQAIEQALRADGPVRVEEARP